MAYTGDPARFTEDFRSVSRYQPLATMDPEGPVLEAETAKHLGTLKKKGSVKQNGSRKSRADSVRSLRLGDPDSQNSFLYTPVPTHSNPTEILANRFQAWRKVLRDLISYFREVQAQYEARARGINKITQTLGSAVRPTDFVANCGIMEAFTVLSDFHKEAAINSESAAKLETEVINTLVGLRSDLNLKIKEIKALSGDFKSNVEKEKEATRKEVLKLQEALDSFDSKSVAGKDPYLIKLGVERQLKRQINEENYLHRAYLNLESSGRELEKIIVSEIQKAYNTYVKILSRDGQELLDLAQRLTMSTLRLPSDYEWSAFIERDPNMVDPNIPLRTLENVEYPGNHHTAVTEVMGGTLERRSKYLKSFTPAWYVLSPTHLHEFKTPDRATDPTPVMSLYLPEATLGKCSDPYTVSHKFVLKARQIGTLHLGHSWVFRAETHATMAAWYEAIKKLTEVSGAERTAYIESTAHRHNSTENVERAESCSSGLENDEADEVPYSGQATEHASQYNEDLLLSRRPEGGRFPSDIQVNRGLGYGSDGSSSSAIMDLSGGSFTFGHYDDSRRNDAAYRESDRRRSQDIDHNDVAAPHALRKAIDGPPSWSADEDYLESESRRNEALDGSPTTQLTAEPAQVQRSTIHSTPGELDSPRAALLGTEETVRYSPEADPREPIPHHEADPAIESPASLDAVAVAPLSGEGLAQQSSAKPLSLAIVDGSRTGGPLELNQPASLGVAERPDAARLDSSNTISNLHIPGSYPRRS